MKLNSSQKIQIRRWHYARDVPRDYSVSVCRQTRLTLCGKRTTFVQCEYYFTLSSVNHKLHEHYKLSQNVSQAVKALEHVSLSRSAMLQRDLATGGVSVRLSVSHAGNASKLATFSPRRNPRLTPTVLPWSQGNTPCEDFTRDWRGKNGEKMRLPIFRSQYFRNGGRCSIGYT